MEKATSADGTTIAYDVRGEGPLAVVVGGAFNDRGTWAALAGALAAQGFRAVSYDRRGRGASGDTEPYAVEREVEDLAAVIAAANPAGPVYAHGAAPGGPLVLRRRPVGAGPGVGGAGDTGVGAGGAVPDRGRAAAPRALHRNPVGFRGGRRSRRPGRGLPDPGHRPAGGEGRG